MSVVDEYVAREKMWPCVVNQSMGNALELRNGSQEIVREIEHIACDSTYFVKEWKEHPVVMKVRKIVSLRTRWHHSRLSLVACLATRVSLNYRQ